MFYAYCATLMPSKVIPKILSTFLSNLCVSNSTKLHFNKPHGTRKLLGILSVRKINIYYIQLMQCNSSQLLVNKIVVVNLSRQAALIHF